MQDVIVVGGGVVGLSIARELSREYSVLLLERASVGEGASWAAAGMLSPLSEADGEGPFFQLCCASHRLFRDFAEQLQQETGVDPGYRNEGGLLSLALSQDAEDVLRGRCEWQRKAGFEVEFLSGEDVRRMEPLITAPVRAALRIPAEGSVAPRMLVKALHDSCLKRGVEVQTGVRVEGIERNAKNAVRSGPARFEAPKIVIAGGVWSADLKGLDPVIPVFPRKGQILSLRMPPDAFHRVIRYQHTYFVPRANGELVVGATEEDAGFDPAVTPSGLSRLLLGAMEISSHTGSYPIIETWTGFRPATPDRLPILGPSAIPGVFYATGHYRNGILLAPITASIIADLLAGRQTSVPIEAYSPGRFQR